MVPYLPDIIKEVVHRVDSVLSNRPDDPFHVYFKHGIKSQVGRSVNENSDCFPLVWHIMNYDENRGNDFSVFSEVSCNLLIIALTENNYTQQQRDDLVIKRRLIPIYEELILQVSNEKKLSTPPINRIRHKVTIMPYWGGGDVNGADTDNLFDKFVDAVMITGLQLKVKHFKNCP